MSSVRGALLFSFVERYALIAISLASNLLVARLLTRLELVFQPARIVVVAAAAYWRESRVCAAALALLALLLWWWPRAPGQPMPWPGFAAAIVSCCVAWLLALVACRYPLAADPAFARLTRFWRRSADNADHKN